MLQLSTMRVCIVLDENGVLVHNTLILIPLQSTVVILRKLEKGFIGSALFRTSYFGELNEWKEMDLDDNIVAFHYEFQVEHSGAYYFETLLHPVVNDSMGQDRKGPMIRFVVQNRVAFDNQYIGFTGLCIQTILSSCIGSLPYFERLLFDSFLGGYNCIHITPMQVRGSSGSCFSIRDFLDIQTSIIDTVEPITYDHQEQFDVLCKTMHHLTVEGKNHYYVLASYIQYLKRKYRMLFITDIIYNHTSFDNPILSMYPEISYNNINTPQLIPAIELDWLIDQVSEEYELRSFEIRSEDAVQEVIQAIVQRLLTVRYYEYWLVDLDEILHMLSSIFTIQSQTNDLPLTDDFLFDAFCACLQEGNIGCRFPLTIDSRLFKQRIQIESLCQEQVARVINQVNQRIHQEIYQPFVCMMTTNLANTIRYRFIQTNGSYPLVERYFTNCTDVLKRKPMNSYTFQHDSCYAANNGWTFDNCRDPMNLFHSSGYLFQNGIQNAAYSIHTKYLNREMVIWSDCVKLRYYDHDTPTFIWSVMKEYTQLSAFIFDGFRLDNCHNTSVDLLQEMLDQGRKTNPKLIVMAELFTSNQEVDIDYISRLGLDMIVRETAQDPSVYNNVQNFADILYQAGGEDLGSLSHIPECSYQIIHTQLPTVLYDITHDNRSFVELYGMAAIPSVTVMLAMSVTHIASTKGMDEGYPVNPCVTTSYTYPLCNRSLEFLDDLETIRTSLLSGKLVDTIQMEGNVYLRLCMNYLHQHLSQYHYTERYVHYYPGTSLISIERRHPKSFYSVFGITHTAFTNHLWSDFSISILGRVVGVFVSVLSEESPFHVLLKLDSVHSFCEMKYDGFAKETTLTFNHMFRPGASLVLLLYNGDRETFSHFLPFHECCTLIEQTEERLASYPNHPYETCQSLLEVVESNSISFSDLSYLLFTSADEQGCWNGWKPYSLESDSHTICTLNNLTHSYHQHHNDYGTAEFKYAGLFGIIPIVRHIVQYNLLSHPLLENLRRGNWLMDYVVDRMNTHPSLVPVQQLIQKEFDFIKHCPRNTRPVKFCHFMILLGDLFEQYIAKRTGFREGNFHLVLATLQFTNRLPGEKCTLIAAGFPHFANGFMRYWGRDTFIAAPGVLLVTNRTDELRELLLDFASTSKHGLICNLRGDGEHARFNSRDAVWWWFLCLQQYCDKTADYGIMKAEVHNRTLEALIQEMMEALGQSIDYVENNAPAIDKHMTSEGFHVQLFVDDETGFVYGGNKWNCGTWMDKMGSYDDGVHSNRGQPATFDLIVISNRPRDGAAIEITAMVARTVNWLHQLHEKGLYAFKGITVHSPSRKEFWSYQQWYRRIKTCFELYYHIQDESIGCYYKDTIGSDVLYQENQLRPNYILAMAIAPSLFIKEHASAALQTALLALFSEKHQLGLKTLSPHDPHYRCYYDNTSRYEGDLEVCEGWSYHNGPEWLWPVGFLVEACCHFPPPNITKKSELKQFCIGLLQEQLRYLQEDDWMSLPEMTNHDGEFNRFACRAQAWSVGCCLCAYQRVMNMG